MECSCINKDESIRLGRTSIIVSGADLPRGRYIAKELAEKGKNVKALVRDPFSEEAQVLAEYGCMVLKGDITKPSKLWLAMNGCYGAVCVIDPVLYSELGEAKSSSMEECVYKFAQRCKEVGMNEFIFCHDGMEGSILESIKLLKFKFFHVVRYPDFCFEDILELFQFSKHTGDDGPRNILKIGSDTLTLSCAEDAGKMFVQLILNSQFYRKRKHAFAVPAETLSTESLAAKLSEVTGRTVECKRVSYKDLKALNYQMHSSLADYFLEIEKRDDESYPNVGHKFELPASKRERSQTSIVLESCKFEDWAIKHKDRLKMKLAGNPILVENEKSGIAKIDIQRRAETQLLVRQLMKASPHATKESLQHTAGSIMEMRIAKHKKTQKHQTGNKGRHIMRTASAVVLPAKPQQLPMSLERKEINGVRSSAKPSNANHSMSISTIGTGVKSQNMLNKSEAETQIREAA
mmetsp:Transcript_42990/g.69884  ORF Transcript_42990/g.69884 Transcript_42990/m.69884 type:complete len:463 (+) Transcript_42990:163-1551(+)